MTAASFEEDDDSPPMLLDRLALNASKSPNKTALTFLGGGVNGVTVESQLTYTQVAEDTDALAKRLLGEKGLKKGDKCILVYPPSLDFSVAFLACLKAGLVAVPVFPPNPARKDTLHMFTKIVHGCGAQHALTSSKYNHMKKLAGIKDKFDKIKLQKNSPTSPASSWPEDLEWIITDANKGRTKSVSEVKLPPVEPSQLAFLQYTSGSTSLPKGVMISHRNLAHNLFIITRELKAAEDTVVVSWLPQYHDMGLIGSYLGVLYCGGRGYYMSPLTFLQRPMIWMEAVSKYGATHLQAPNFAYKLTARKFTPKDYTSRNDASSHLDLSSVRHMINGAEPVDEASINLFLDAFSPFGLRKDVMFPTYGLAEHTVFVCSGGKQVLTVKKRALEVEGVIEVAKKPDDTVDNISSEENEATATLVGCGYPSKQNVEVRIVNADSRTVVGVDIVGEIWVRSPSKAMGYYGMDEETKHNFGAILSLGANDGSADEGDNAADSSNIPNRSYLRTGDLGFFHKGELFICGRLKDLIIVGGRNHYPQDIEATAEATSDFLRPGCSAAFSVNIIGADAGEVALVMEIRDVHEGKQLLNQARPQMEELCSSIIQKVRAAINQEHSLAITHFVIVRPRSIPKTTSGKIARSWCRKAFHEKKLNIVYSRKFGETPAPPVEGIESKLEEGTNGTSAAQTVNAEHLRSLDNATILNKLKVDVCRLGTIEPESLDVQAPLVTLLDSLTISQFKGMLEAQYATELSDEYLFRESTTIDILVEVVKLGYAPDDVGREGGDVAPERPAMRRSGGGIAGALGCPPGVVCCAVM